MSGEVVQIPAALATSRVLQIERSAEEVTMSRRVKWVQEQLPPRWRVVIGSTGRWCAQSPSYADDGLMIEADSPEDLVERVRNLIRIIAIAQGLAGKLGPTAPVAGERIDWPPEGWTPPAVTTGSLANTSGPPAKTPTPPAPPTPPTPPTPPDATGETCWHCGGFLVRRGTTCLQCPTCHESSGCS